MHETHATCPLKMHRRAIALQKNRASSNFPQDDTNYSGMLGMQRGLTADDDVGPHKHVIEGERAGPWNGGAWGRLAMGAVRFGLEGTAPSWSRTYGLVLRAATRTQGIMAAMFWES